MRSLITGVTGFLGVHLARLLVEEEGAEVWGFKRWRSAGEGLFKVRPALRVIEGDILDPLSVESAIAQTRPDQIFHLAAQSYPSESLVAPAVTLTTNIIGTLNLLQAVRKHAPNCTVHVAGSAAQYGVVTEADIPISESHPCRPVNPYGISKLAQELLAVQYFETYGIPTVITRSFNHIGPWQDERTCVQTFAKQIAEIEVGQREPVVRVGNLAAQRDFLDGRDAVRAFRMVVAHGTPGRVYNVCSGEGHAIQEILDILLELSQVKAEIRVDESRLRPVDEPIYVGDNSRLKADTGWSPRFSPRETLATILDHWRTMVQRQR